MSTLAKATYRLNVIPIEISIAFFLEIGKNTKANLGFWFFLIFGLFFSLWEEVLKSKNTLTIA